MRTLFPSGSLVNAYLHYKKGKVQWENQLDAAYGMLQSGKGKARKTDDKLDMTSKAGIDAGRNLFYTALVNFKSQFTKGYHYPDDSTVHSRFFAPGYLLLSLGLDYKPEEGISVFLSPLTAKLTFVSDQALADAGAFGVEKAVYDTSGMMISPGKSMRTELGAFLKFEYKKKILENVLLHNKLEVFSNYLNHPENLDIFWDVLLSLRVNKFISATLNTTLVYDHDIAIPVYRDIGGVMVQTGSGPRVQFKETLGVGLAYSF